ncbi:YlxM family DNA-binding protein [Lactobacillus sp. LL6]|uniref:YlxM family DNA-binding protein n=1 Tax=Lactobacillus sp. LL6 TaxID=2596827 RepID=UPI001186B1DE|nr:transcriptional regulator [Lactobacillus sp. LL6]TSO26489.1 transcriptional regulator [Lactobacillus sp. LL6]
MDELTKNEKLGDLYAYYGKLLTKGQQSYFEDYYYNDLSLGEIADNHNVSRQAIYDNLKRSTKSLKKYESSLHMQSDYNKIEDNLELTVKLLDQGEINQAKEKIQNLLNKMRGE